MTQGGGGGKCPSPPPLNTALLAVHTYIRMYLVSEFNHLLQQVSWQVWMDSGCYYKKVFRCKWFHVYLIDTYVAIAMLNIHTQRLCTHIYTHAMARGNTHVRTYDYMEIRT